MKPESEIPLQKNDSVTVKIDDLSHEGVGVGKYNGFALFIKNALPGEIVEAKVIKIKKRFGIARLMNIIEQSPDRIEPPCHIFGACGGCQIQHLRYEAQLEQKGNMISEHLQRIGHVDMIDVTKHAPLGMQNPWRYRNKAQVPFGFQKGESVAGFYRQGTHDIIPMDECLIQHSHNDQAIQEVKRIALELNIPFYSEQKKRGFLRHVLVKYALATGQMMIVMITNGESFPQKKKFVERLRASFPDVNSIMQSINTDKTNVILGQDIRCLWGETYIYDDLGDIQFAISAQSFYQVNPIQTEVLYQSVLDFANLQGDETVVDVYCGIGTISLFLAAHAKQVIGIEVVPQAVEDARRNAKLNGFEHLIFEEGKAEELLPEWVDQGQEMDVIIVDPPRKGCDPALLDAILQAKPQKLIYVSCNPATLARDVELLQEGEYKLREIQPVDMFPQTMHVECVALMSRVEK